jgi:hypothetical protein
VKVPPASFVQFCGGLHQDALLDANSTDELVRDCLKHVPAEARPELASYLAHLLATQTASEIKGVFKRQRTSIRFTSASVHAFATCALAQLQDVLSRSASSR